MRTPHITWTSRQLGALDESGTRSEREVAQLTQQGCVGRAILRRMVCGTPMPKTFFSFAGGGAQQRVREARRKPNAGKPDAAARPRLKTLREVCLTCMQHVATS